MPIGSSNSLNAFLHGAYRPSWGVRSCVFLHWWHRGCLCPCRDIHLENISTIPRLYPRSVSPDRFSWGSITPRLQWCRRGVLCTHRPPTLPVSPHPFYMLRKLFCQTPCKCCLASRFLPSTNGRGPNAARRCRWSCRDWTPRSLQDRPGRTERTRHGLWHHAGAIVVLQAAVDPRMWSS
jgi:hypothetical protein